MGLKKWILFRRNKNGRLKFKFSRVNDYAIPAEISAPGSG